MHVVLKPEVAEPEAFCQIVNVVNKETQTSHQRLGSPSSSSSSLSTHRLIDPSVHHENKYNKDEDENDNEMIGKNKIHLKVDFHTVYL